MEYLLIFFVLTSATLCADVVATPLLLLTLPNRSRRLNFNFDMNDVSAVVGVPGMPSHLPEAEPILPGHTLIRPTLGMLKSSIKFPHRELDDGAGVNGNLDNLGLKWYGRNERVLYSGFRRSDSLLDHELDNEVLDNYQAKSIQSDEKPTWFRRSGGPRRYAVSAPSRRRLADYVVVVPIAKKPRSEKPRYALTNLVLDLDDNPKNGEDMISERLQIIPKSVKPKNSNRLFLYLANDRKGPVHLSDLFKADNSVFTL